MKIIVYFISLFCLMSCSGTKTISYKKENLKPFDEYIPITVEIKELVDLRKDNVIGRYQYSMDKKEKLEGKNICINSEKHYKKETVGAQISQQIAEHFESVRLFKETTFGNINNADYYITGNIMYFYGEQNFSQKAQVGSQFGLIGALATSGTKTPGKVIIELSDLNLYKKNGTLVKNIGDFRQEYQEDMPADGYCWCIYDNVNQKLKDFNDELSEKIKAELKDIQL